MIDLNKTYKIAVVALIFSLIGLGIYGTIQPEINGFHIIANNTDLCNYNHTSNDCNGIRHTGIKYYNPNSAIEIFLTAHANSPNQNAEIILNINGTNVSYTSGRPLGGGQKQHINKSLRSYQKIQIIPLIFLIIIIMSGENILYCQAETIQ